MSYTQKKIELVSSEHIFTFEYCLITTFQNDDSDLNQFIKAYLGPFDIQICRVAIVEHVIGPHQEAKI